MTTDRRCLSCHAIPRAGDTRFCGYCGAELPSRPWTPLDHPKGDTAARLAAVRADADFERARSIQVSSAPVVARHGCLIGAALVFLGAAGLFTANIRAFPGGGSFWGTHTFVIFIVALIGLFILIQSIAGAARFARAEPQAYPAGVVRTRTSVSGGGENSSASTTYFVTLEDEHGRRREFEVPARMAGQLADGDVGVAHVRGGALLHYARFFV